MFVYFTLFSLSGSTPSVSSCSSRSLSLSGSRGSLSASSRGSGSLNSLNYPDMSHSGGSEMLNLRELHQRVTDMLQTMPRDVTAAFPPMYGVRTSGVPTSYTPTSGRATHPSASNSSQVSLSSHSPPISPSTSDRSPTQSPATAPVVATEGESTAVLDGTELERSSLTQVSFIQPSPFCIKKVAVTCFVTSLRKGPFSFRSKENGDVCMQTASRWKVSLCSSFLKLQSIPNRSLTLILFRSCTPSFLAPFLVFVVFISGWRDTSSTANSSPNHRGQIHRIYQRHSLYPLVSHHEGNSGTSAGTLRSVFIPHGVSTRYGCTVGWIGSSRQRGLRRIPRKPQGLPEQRWLEIKKRLWWRFNGNVAG